MYTSKWKWNCKICFTRFTYSQEPLGAVLNVTSTYETTKYDHSRPCSLPIISPIPHYVQRMCLAVAGVDTYTRSQNNNNSNKSNAKFIIEYKRGEEKQNIFGKYLPFYFC